MIAQDNCKIAPEIRSNKINFVARIFRFDSRLNRDNEFAVYENNRVSYLVNTNSHRANYQSKIIRIFFFFCSSFAYAKLRNLHRRAISSQTLVCWLACKRTPLTHTHRRQSIHQYIDCQSFACAIITVQIFSR